MYCARNVNLSTAILLKSETSLYLKKNVRTKIGIDLLYTGKCRDEIQEQKEVPVRYAGIYRLIASTVCVSLTTGWTTGRSGFDSRRGQRIFPLACVSRPALGPTQHPVQWVPGSFPRG
jgi:hypothetical protein